MCVLNFNNNIEINNFGTKSFTFLKLENENSKYLYITFSKIVIYKWI